MKNIFRRFVALVGPAIILLACAWSSEANAPVTVGNVRAEWKTKSTDPGKGKLYMKLYLTATVNAPVDRSESLYAKVDCQAFSDDHSGGLLHELSAGQSKDYDFPIFISDPLDRRPESCNITFSWGKTKSKSAPFTHFCLMGNTVNSGACGTETSATPTIPSTTPSSPAASSAGTVTVSNPRLDWKTKASGADKGKVYFKLFFDAHVNSQVNKGEQIFVTSECKVGGLTKSDEFNVGSSKLYEVPVGQASALEYLFFYSDALDSKPESCNLIFRFGKMQKEAARFTTFCYNGMEVNTGSCW